jgi:hypothetical protein
MPDIRYSGTLVPNGARAIARQADVKGGAHAVADVAARNAIPSYLREEGMTAYVASPPSEYRLVGGILDANWVLLTGAIGDDASSVFRFQDEETAAPISNLVSGGPAVTLADIGGTGIRQAPGLYGTTKRSVRIVDADSGLWGASSVAVPASWTMCFRFRPLPNSAGFGSAPRVIAGRSHVASPGSPVSSPGDWDIAIFYPGACTQGDGSSGWKAGVRRSGQGAFDLHDISVSSGKEMDFLQYGVWQHIALSMDGTFSYLYRDAVILSVINCAGATDTNAAGVWGLGRTVAATGAQGCAGQFQDFRLFNTTKTQAEIMAIVQAGILGG